MGDHDQREPGQPVDSEPVASLDRRRRLKALERVAEAVERDEPVGPEMTRDLHTGGNLSPVPDILRRPLRTIGEAGDDWLRCRPPDRDHLLMREGRGALNQGAVGMLVGPGGRGKSWLLCQLALSVATGRDWLDYFEVVRPGRVLLALAEEDGHEIWRRLYWAARAMKLTDEEADAAAANIVPLPLRGTPVGLVEGENRSVGPTAAFHALREQLGRDDYRLVVLDPLARFAPDVESNNAAATAAVQVVEELTKGPGHPTVIVCHHSNKESRKTGSEGGPGMNRGVTGLHDAARWEAQLLGKGEDDLALKLSKGNYVPPGGEPIPLERRDADEWEFSYRQWIV